MAVFSLSLSLSIYLSIYLSRSDGSRESSLTSNLLVDMGALHVLGPAPLTQDKTCVAGLTCSFDGFAGHYSTSNSDQFYVLDTCGQDRGWGLAGLPCLLSVCIGSGGFGFRFSDPAQTVMAL